MLEPATGFLGCGTVFKLDRTGKFTVLHTFNGADGVFPDGWLVRDNAGNLYGMTGNGGDLNGCSGLGCGVVFKVDRTGKETALYRFDGRRKRSRDVRWCGPGRGGQPLLTAYGPDFSGSLRAGTGCGVAFKLSPTGRETVLHTFTGGIAENRFIYCDSARLHGTRTVRSLWRYVGHIGGGDEKLPSAQTMSTLKEIHLAPRRQWLIDRCRCVALWTLSVARFRRYRTVISVP